MPVVDLHVHSTASDGKHSPEDVVRRAQARGLAAIALTDHDTVDGVARAQDAGRARGVRVVAGCEFSVASRWGELHLLAYFLPVGSGALEAFLREQRDHRRARAAEIVARLNRAGVRLTVDEVMTAAAGGAVGRPHVARALVARDLVPTVEAAFHRYLGRGRSAFVAKSLPTAARVTELVRSVGGVTAAAHLGERVGRSVLQELAQAGMDGVEVLHPSHGEATVRRLDTLAGELGLVRTGGSDWHGDHPDDPERAPLGSLDVPAAWLDEVECLHEERRVVRPAP